MSSHRSVIIFQIYQADSFASIHNNPHVSSSGFAFPMIRFSMTGSVIV